MGILYRLIPLLMALQAAPAAATAASTPPAHDNLEWIERMVVAAQRTNYSGTFVYQYGNQVETTRITHIWDRGGEHGRLEGLDGVHRESEIVRHHGHSMISSDQAPSNFGKHHGRQPFPSLLTGQISLLTGNYRLVIAEESRVAGFPAQALLFQPRDSQRYTYKIWAHRDSGLPLRVAVLDDRNRVVEQYYFTQLDIGGNVDRKRLSRGKPAHSYHSYHSYAVPPKNSGDAAEKPSGWRAGYLPSGFVKTVEIQRQLRDGMAPATHLVYSDGLAGISIFIEGVGKNDDPGKGLSSRGAINIFRKRSGNNLVTVVGEAPPRTVMQIAESVRFHAP